MVFDVNFWQVRPAINIGKYGIEFKSINIICIHIYIYNYIIFKFLWPHCHVSTIEKRVSQFYVKDVTTRKMQQ